MNYYKVLGIEENATQEEIRQAYEKQVKLFKLEVKDEKRLDKFLDLFKEAYDALIYKEAIVEDQQEEIFDQEVSALFKNNKIKEKAADVTEKEEVINSSSENIEGSYAATVLMSREEILRESLIQYNKSEEEKIIFKSKEDFEDCDGFFDDEDDDDEEDFDEKIIKRIKQKNSSKNKKSSNQRKNNSSKKNNASKNDKEYNDRDRDRDRDSRGLRNRNSNKKGVVKKEKASHEILNVLLIPLKIIALPIIAILSILIFICRIISISSWLVAKIIIIGVIAIAAIHGYQIYTGQEVINYNIFIACGIGFIVSLFLPSIVRIVPNMLQGINNSLKNFVF